jgi:AraC-like DNA-binding protein
MPDPVRFVSTFRNPAVGGAYCKMHGHRYIEIIYHASGVGRTRTADGHEWHFEPGTVVVHRAGDRHEQWMDRAGVDHCLQVELLDRALLPGFDSFCLPLLHDPQARRELAELESWIAGDDPLSRRILDLRASSVLLALWREHREGRAEARGGSAVAWVRRARRAVLRDPATLNTVADLAGHLGLSPDHLRHVFADVEGRSPKQFILDQRIERVRDLLRHSPSTLDEIAAVTGFANARQLCTTYRRRTGQTPGAYRRAAAAG